MLGHADASSCMQEQTEALQRCAAHAVSPEAVTNLLVTMGANPVPGPRESLSGGCAACLPLLMPPEADADRRSGCFSAAMLLARSCDVEQAWADN